MRIKLEERYKEFYTIMDVERAKAIIEQEKEDEMSAKEWAEYAVKEALRNTGDWLDTILKAEAHTAMNCRVWNAYSNDSGNMDVWIEATAETMYGFIKLGAYLSDIWQTGAVEYKEHMYIRYFKEVKTA